MNMNQNPRYPRTVSIDDCDIELCEMAAGDENATHAFATALPAHDLLYVARDITNPKVVAAWVQAAVSGAATTVLARQGKEIVGTAALICDPHSWSPHLGELRVLVSNSMRHKGLGRLLIQECFLIAVDRGLRKLVAQMTVDQAGAIAIFEEMGFRGEALLKEHVMDRDRNTHDIVMLSCDVERIHNQVFAYGARSDL